MTDGLRTRAMALVAAGGKRDATRILIFELLAEIELVTAERDKWLSAANKWAEEQDLLEETIVRQHAEIERLRDLAAAMGAMP